MKIMLVLIAVFAFSQIAGADITDDYGWEGSATIFGMYPADCVTDDIATTPPDPVHTGLQSLFIEKNIGGTAQSFVGWVVGLTDGDSVTVSIWIYDDSPGGYPSGRLWGHWCDSTTDPTNYEASAGGSGDYSSGIGWEQNSNTWTVGSGHTALTIQARSYGDSASVLYFDDISITAPDGAEIRFPGYVALQPSTWAEIKASF